jgi:hypothetical protein
VSRAAGGAIGGEDGHGRTGSHLDDFVVVAVGCRWASWVCIQKSSKVQVREFDKFVVRTLSED